MYEQIYIHSYAYIYTQIYSCLFMSIYVYLYLNIHIYSFKYQDVPVFPKLLNEATQFYATS